MHQGNPSADTGRIKEEQCKVDRFILIIDDVCLGGVRSAQKDTDDNIIGREIEINIVNLCWQIVRTAKGYYENNKDKFNFFDYELRDMRNGNCKYWI